MKFGDTLLQGSVPQWRNYNVDYTTLKSHFKRVTLYSSGYIPSTPAATNCAVNANGEAKPVSIPGQAGKSSRDEQPLNVDERLFLVLKGEHDRVGLFVRSKGYEINSRLRSIERLLNQLERKKYAAATSLKPKNNLRLRQKFSKVESDILILGNEIQSLSRFISINKLAIRKLLRKYEKLTGSNSVTGRVERQLLSHTESFAQYDLEQAVSRYTTFLQAVREPFNTDRARPKIINVASDPFEPPVDSETRLDQEITSLAKKSLESETDFDSVLSTSCSNRDMQETAVYWIHTDNIVELRILLLQYMRYAEFAEEHAAELRRKSSKSDTGSEQVSNCGAIVISNRTTAAPSEASNVTVQPTSQLSASEPAAISRWAIDGGKTISIQTIGREDEDPHQRSKVKIKNGDLSTLLRFTRRASSGDNSSASDDEYLYQSDDDIRTSSSLICKYLGNAAEMDPVACTFYKRNRFLGLENNNTRLCLAALDENLHFCGISNTVGQGHSGQTQRFPHAILTVQLRGKDNGLIRTLDRSHLTESVPGFSFEAHAYSMRMKDRSNGQLPPWLSKLNTDIRHIPTEEPILSSPQSETRIKNANISAERLTSTSSDNLQTPNLTSRSGTSGSGPVTPNTTGCVNTMVGQHLPWTNNTMTSNEPSQGSRSAMSSRQVRISAHALPTQQQTPHHKYWNEYDNPGSDAGAAENEALFIYVDPDAPLFPGQIMLSRWRNKVVKFFTARNSSDDQDLEADRRHARNDHQVTRRLRPQISNISSSSSEDNNPSDWNADADDEQSQATAQIQEAGSQNPYQPLMSAAGLGIHGHAETYGTFRGLPESHLLSQASGLGSVFSETPRENGRWITLPALGIIGSVVTLTVISTLLHASRTSLQGRSQANVAILVGVAAALAFVLVSLRQSGDNSRDYEGNENPPPGSPMGPRGIVATMAAILVCVWAGVIVALVVVF